MIGIKHLGALAHRNADVSVVLLGDAPNRLEEVPHLSPVQVMGRWVREKRLKRAVLPVIEVSAVDVN